MLGVYTPKMIDGYGCVNYSGTLQSQKNLRIWMRQVFRGCTSPKQLPDTDASIIMGVYSPKIIDGHGCVNYVGGLHPKTNCRTWMRQLFSGSTPPK